MTLLFRSELSCNSSSTRGNTGTNIRLDSFPEGTAATAVSHLSLCRCGRGFEIEAPIIGFVSTKSHTFWDAPHVSLIHVSSQVSRGLRCLVGFFWGVAIGVFCTMDLRSSSLPTEDAHAVCAACRYSVLVLDLGDTE